MTPTEIYEILKDKSPVECKTFYRTVSLEDKLNYQRFRDAQQKLQKRNADRKIYNEYQKNLMRKIREDIRK